MKVKGSKGDDTLRGSSQDDVLLGLDGRDVLIGNRGNDTLDGGRGDDDLRGGAGDDLYIVDNINDITRSLLDRGHDTVRSSVSYVLGAQQEDLRLLGSANLAGTGHAGANQLTGNSGRNLLSGAGGNDVLDGGAGDDDLRGGTGNDTYKVDNSNDISRAVSDAGVDTVLATVSYLLGAQQEHLSLFGAEALSATGNDNANTLTGNAAANVINGGGGADSLFGQDGDDRFVFDAADVIVNGGLGIDTLIIAGAAVELDLTANTSLVNIEVIDLDGGGDHRLVLDAASVLRVANYGHVLRVDGDVGDVLVAGGAWTGSAAVLVDGLHYVDYTRDGATLRVDSAVTLAMDVADIGLNVLLAENRAQALNPVTDGQTNFYAAAAIGDFNGDGLADYVIDAQRQPSSENSFHTEDYLVFGAANNSSADISLAALDGDNGSVALGGRRTTISVAAHPVGVGDFDGDGFDDVMLNHYGYGLGGYGGVLLFGRSAGLPASFEVGPSFPDGSLALVSSSENGHFLRSVAGSVGDFNGDGYDDAMWALEEVFGAPLTSVVYGGPRTLASSFDIDTLDGQSGFQLRVIGAPDALNRGFLPFAVGTVGDINGDGFDDFALSGTGDFDDGSAATFVVFGGSADAVAVRDVTDLDGSNGFRISGPLLRPTSQAHGLGDFNGDGIEDMVLSLRGAAEGSGAEAGGAYVIFGAREGFAARLDLAGLDGSNGFKLTGVADGDFTGVSVDSAGDFNGDGFDDLLISAPGAGQGALYVVFGTAANTGAVLSLAALDGRNGMRITGLATELAFGYAGGAGDVNGDGFDDIAVASVDSGYVIFGAPYGRAQVRSGGAGDDTLDGTAGDDALLGAAGNDLLDGGAGNDVLKGGAGDDVLVFDSADTQRVEGDSGIDTLRFDGAGQHLDLTAIDSPRYSGIERIDLGGSGDNSLTLNLADLLALSDRANVFIDNGTRQLVIDGNAGDSVLSQGQGWVAGDTLDLRGALYTSYTVSGSAVMLLIETAVTQTLS